MKKLTRRRFLQIWVPLAVILLITVLCCTILMNGNAALMDLTFGKGKRKIVNLYGGAREANYYDLKFSSAEEAAANGKSLTEKIADEGIVLLKNNGILPLERGSGVTPFGYRYLFPNYGPSSGSAVTWSDKRVTAEEALQAVYAVNAEVVEKMKKAVPQGLTANGYIVRTEESELKADVWEFAPDIYNGTEKSCAGTVGVVFIGRAGGEGIGSDITSRPLYDGTVHGAAISVYEKRALQFAKRYCEKVVVILNCCNPMELSELIVPGEMEADAILWIGGTGSAGFKAMTNIMTGEISPSGRLPDIYVSDSAKNPVYANYGDYYKYTNVVRDAANQVYENFLEYEEGVYNGYRYYETAAAEDPDFVYGKVDGTGAAVIAGAVTYPFGYGLSYSRFHREIADFRTVSGSVYVDVRVTNTGDRAAKDVVQIYYTPPYTAFSAEYEMEKPAVNLAGFAKTDLLEPGKSRVVTVEFKIEDMASYSSVRDNSDGTFGCYILESGAYEVSLRNNSHDVIETRTISVPETVYYDKDNLRSGDAVAVTNRFCELTKYMAERTVRLTRADWKNTQPSSPRNFLAPDYVLAVFESNKNFRFAAEESVDGNAPTADNAGDADRKALTASSMRGADYDDPAWDALLDELDYSAADLWNTLHLGYMQTGEIKSVGLQSAQFRDGPLGLTATANDGKLGSSTSNNSYCAMPVLAATFNLELAYRYGEAVACEAMWYCDGELPVSGWYAPGLNVHRGPFGGRYYEYFSEDPLLIGLTAAHIASGAADNGLSVVLKHFAANNQDTVRDGLNTWMTEQTLREIYLRPYEICIKTASSQLKYLDGSGEYTVKTTPAVRGIMTSKNALGATFCGTSRALVTEVLKGEWNFKGMVISDLIFDKSGSLYAKMFGSGVNIIMCMRINGYADGLKSEVGKQLVRESVHAVCYTVANSNAMQGVPPGAIAVYGTPPWLAVMVAFNILVVCFIIAMTLITVFAFKPYKS